MNIINQSVQLIEKPEFADRMSVLKYLEKIGRVCYKSEDRITDESCVKFIKMLRDRKHWAMLEHFIFTFEVPKEIYFAFNHIIVDINDAKVQQFSRYFTKSVYVDKYGENHCLISASATAINNMINIEGFYVEPVMALAKRLHAEIPELILLPETDNEAMLAFNRADEKDIVILQPHNVEQLPRNIRMQHDWFTALYVTNRGCCYDEETKVLTKSGWKYFRDVTEDDEFYTLNDNEEIEFIKADKKIAEHYEGEMYHFHSTQIDLNVTPNHNMWVFDYDKRSEKTKCWKFLRADELTNQRYGFKKSAKLIRDNNNELVVPETFRSTGYTGQKKYPEYIPSDRLLWYELLGYWITDGSISYGKHGYGNRMIITQVKPIHRERIEYLLIQLNISYSVYRCTYRINNPAIFDYIADHFILSRDNVRKSYYITMPRDIMNSLTSEEANALLKGIIGGNGSKHTNAPGYQIYTASIKFAEDLVELALLCGKSANIYAVSPRTRKFPSGRISYCKTQYVVSVVTTHDTLLCINRSDNSYIHREKYNGQVYCVELPKWHRLYVMRNGKACWCGNSHEIVRHRPFSYAQESTRYVKYGDITVIKPLFDVNTSSNETELQKYNAWRHAMETTEQTYSKLLDLGAKPQEARGVLPNDLKTEINQTGRLESWVHFFNMRCDNAAHPQMREVAEQLYDQAAKYAPGVFPEITRE